MTQLGRLAAVVGTIGALLAAMAVSAAAWPPRGSFVVAGEIGEPVLASTADVVGNLGSLPFPARTVTVTFRAGNATEQHTFTGVLLYDVITFLVPQFNPAVRNDQLRFYVAATGSDGYQAIVSLGRDPSDVREQGRLAGLHPGRGVARRERSAAGRARRHPGRALRLRRRQHPGRAGATGPGPRVPPARALG